MSDGFVQVSGNNLKNKLRKPGDEEKGGGLPDERSRCG